MYKRKEKEIKSTSFIEVETAYITVVKLLISPGIPTQVGQNHSQIVFAGWYDNS